MLSNESYMKRVINEVFPTVASCQGCPYYIVSTRIDWEARRNRKSYRFVRPGIPIYDACQSPDFFNITAEDNADSLEFLQRVRIRPYPRSGGHGCCLVIKRGGRVGSGGFEMCRRKKDPEKPTHRRRPVASRACKGTESRN